MRLPQWFGELRIVTTGFPICAKKERWKKMDGRDPCDSFVEQTCGTTHVGSHYMHSYQFPIYNFMSRIQVLDSSNLLSRILRFNVFMFKILLLWSYLKSPQIQFKFSILTTLIVWTRSGKEPKKRLKIKSVKQNQVCELCFSWTLCWNYLIC